MRSTPKAGPRMWIRACRPPTWTWIPPGYPGYDAASPMKFDPELAKKALAESSFGGPEKLNALGLKLTYGDSPRNRTRSEWLAANYKEILGIDIALDPVDATTFTALTKDPATFPLFARQGWCADYPDPQNWLSVYWKSDTTFAQRQGYKNEELDKLTAQADVELDAAKRVDLYKQAQQAAAGGLPERVRLQQRERLPGEAVGQGHRQDAAGLRLAGRAGPRQGDHRHRDDPLTG